MIATSIEQSKKLLELGLDPKTADMFWRHSKIDNHYYLITVDEYEKMGSANVPAWSISALFNLIPNGYLVKKNYAGMYIAESLDHKQTTFVYNFPLEAAYNMICYLIENNCIKIEEL